MGRILHCFVLLAFLGGLFVAFAVAEVPQLNRGLVFLRQGDVLMTGDYWTITLDVDMSIYGELTRGLQTTIEWTLDFLDSSDRDRSVPPPKGILDNSTTREQRAANYAAEFVRAVKVELARVDSELREVAYEVNSFNELLPKVRRRRALIDLGGKGLRYLFGTATTDDVDELNDKVEAVLATQQGVVQVVQEQLTIMQGINDQVTHNAREISAVATNLKESIIDWHSDASELHQEIHQVKHHLTYISRVTTIARKIEVALIHFKVRLMQIQEAIDVTSGGRLSSIFLNPGNLSSILQTVVLHLPQDLQLLTGTTLDQCYAYYDMATVKAIATTKVIRLFIKLPLKAADRTFELYQIKTLPYLDAKLGFGVSVENTKEYLAVSNDRQMHMLMTLSEFLTCQQGSSFVICPADLALYTYRVESCEIAMFLGEEEAARRTCDRRILPDGFQPKWFRTPDKTAWIYSVPGPTKLVQRCRQVAAGPGGPTRTVTGTGILTMSNNCYYYANQFKLLPFSNGRTQVTLDAQPIFTPEIPIIHDEEYSQINFHNLTAQEDIKMFMSEQSIRNNEGKRSLKINALLNHIDHIKQMQSSSKLYHSIAFSFTGLIFLISILALSWYLRRRCRRFSTHGTARDYDVGQSIELGIVTPTQTAVVGESTHEHRENVGDVAGAGTLVQPAPRLGTYLQQGGLHQA